MDMTTRQGGIFEVIDIDKATIYTSSIEANEFNVSEESAVIEGRLNAPYVTNSGSLEVTSTLETHTLKNKRDAILRISDHVVGQSIDNAGMLELGGHLKAEHLKSTGRLISEGVIEGETVILEGPVKVREIRAEHIELTLTADCVADYLTANQITINAKRENLLFKDKDHSLKVNEIDGGRVYIENVIAELVRGDEVVIGPNCTVKVVEYTENYTLDDQSDVLELGKITRD
ncbi:hypothetical protein [Macrococcus carouselicus]|uniref:Uncharacterized protein n=1 Tax=Macrococcus carouselicus TaxID=69969 RepID=A0A9Q8CL52_9STAP|nr:hypothetical protein [Macrococcus carouselicus]TDM00816.1 hypothetical protein ERX40_08370 [Macrococcus carouselicus]